jgi:phage-related protein
MNLFDLAAKISLDTSEYEKGMNKSKSIAETVGSGIKTAMKVGAAAIGAATTAVGALTKASLDNYATYEQMVGGVETLFKDSASIVEQYAANAYQTAGLSANAYMETVTSFSASLLQSLDNDTTAAANKADRAITDMSDNANKMGTSMESIQNAYQGFAKQNYTMLDNLKIGYGGTKSEMERLIADANALNEAQGKATNYTIDSYADIVDAIHDVQTNLGITGTTAKEAATTIEGSVNSMKAAWANLSTGLADETADLDGLINTFVESVATAGDNIIPRVEQILTSISNAIGTLTPIVTDTISELVGNVLPEMLSAGTDVLMALVQGITSALPQLIPAAFDILNQLATGIIENLPQLIEAAKETIQALATGIAENLPSLIAASIEITMALVDAIIDNIDTIIDAGIEIIQALVDGITENLPTLIEKLPVIVEKIVEAITENLPTLIDATIEIVTSLVDGIIQNLPLLIDATIEIIIALVEGIIENLPTLIEGAIELVTALATGIIENLPLLIEKMPELIMAIIQGIVNALPALAAEGQEIVSTLVNAIVSLVGKLKDAGKKLLDGFVNKIKSVLSTVTQLGLTIVVKLATAITGAVSKVTSAARNIVNAIKNKITGLATSALTWGRDMIDNFVNGIRQKISNITSAVSDVASTIKSYLGFSEPEEGPLSNFHTYAPDMIDLFSSGIKQNAYKLKDTFDGALSDMGVVDGVVNISANGSGSGSDSGTSMLSRDTYNITINMGGNGSTKTARELAENIYSELEKIKTRKNRALGVV